MLIKKTLRMLLPTAQYANIQLEVGAEVDTNETGTGAKETADMLSAFLEKELFDTKDALELRPAKDFKLTPGK